MAHPRGGEIKRFVTFFVHLFVRFLGQPTGRNFGQNCTLNGSKVVFRLIYVPFGGLVPSNLLWGSAVRKTAKLMLTGKSLDYRILAKNRFNIRALRVNYPKRQDTPIKVTFLIESYKLGIHFSRWWFNRKCTFQDGCCRHLGFRKTASISLVFDWSSPTLVNTLGLQFGTNRWCRKCLFVRIQDGSRHHLEL